MDCPKCGRRMTAKRRDVSRNEKTGARYSRAVYVCKPDDVWVSVEVPRKAPVKKKAR